MRDRQRAASEFGADTDTRLPAIAHEWRAPQGVKVVDDPVFGEFLVYDVKATRSSRRSITVGPGLLEGFLRLNESDSETIKQYAEEYGVLGLCDHNWPCYACPEVDGVDNPSGKESLTEWRRLSATAGLIVNSARKLRGASPPKLAANDLERLIEFGGYGLFVHAKMPNTVALGREAIERSVTRWLTDGDARIAMRWPSGAPGPGLVMGSPSAPDAGLYSAIGIQLALACSREEGLWTCSYCGRLHGRSRSPRANQNIYCDECRAAGVPVRLANRERYRRLREERST